ncbi:outer membrane beta-barrel protein [Nitrosomonas ureae]|uniref:outer membrane beta-barrel protein n=1 Tax=Nitrosomonas ureae TaxID=44577 RepID=UPI003B8A70A8
MPTKEYLVIATYNTNNPSNGFNGAETFADRANRFQLNQMYFILQRNVKSEGKNGILAVVLISYSAQMPLCPGF